MNVPTALRLGALRLSAQDASDDDVEGIDLDRPEPLRVGVHDTSRVEWVVTLPLTNPREYSFELDFHMEIPANLITPHDVWAHFQELGRLHSPDTEAFAGGAADDDLRRSTLAVVHRLKIVTDRHGRACMIANSLLLQEPRADVRSELEPSIDDGVQLVSDARVKLASLTASAGASPAESRLADEFLSTKLMDFLSELDRDVTGTLIAESARFRTKYLTAAEALRKRIASELAAELKRRAEKGFINPSAENTDALEDFLERASHLKKHFQEVLFLEMVTRDAKLKNVVAVVAASIAAVFYVLAMWGPAQLTGTGIGVGTTALITAVFYSMKDRIKEISRGWLSHRLENIYGARTVALSIPARLMKSRPQLVTSRDVFLVTYENRHDALNPDVGAIRRVAVFEYRKKGKVEQTPATARELDRKGLRNVKQIFRFDLSAVFPRLDDPVKRVPVLSKSGQDVQWVDAPRTYHFPVTTKLVTPAGTVTQSGEIVAQKGGIARFDLDGVNGEPPVRSMKP